MKAYTLSLLLASIFFFGILIFVSRLLYKTRMNVKYSFRNMFPFELNYKVYFKDNLYTHIFIALFTMSAIAFYATINLSFNNGFLLFTTIAGIICAFLIMLLFYIPLVNLRFHIILVAFFFTLSFAISGSILIAAWRENQVLMTWQTITSIVLSITFGLMQFALIMNPKLNLNFKPIEVVKENGEKEYLRPKGIVLAFSEWFLILLYILNMINVFILMLSVNA